MAKSQSSTTALLKEGKQVEFKTADKYTPTPGLPHNKMHSKNYKPDVSVPKR